MLKITVDQEKCNGCGRCTESCPGEVYELKDEKAMVVNLEGCHYCRTCEDVCEQDACHIADEE